MPRTKFIAGNWKMFTTGQTGRELAAAVVKSCAGWAGVRVAVCPPFPYLSVVGEVLRKNQPAERMARKQWPLGQTVPDRVAAHGAVREIKQQPIAGG